MQKRRPIKREYTLTGTGVGFVSTACPQFGDRGTIDTIIVREPVGGTLTVGNLYAVDQGDTLAAAPVDEHIVWEVTGQAFTAHATDSSYRQQFPDPPAYQGTTKDTALRIGVNATAAAGAWSLVIMVAGWLYE